MVEAQRLPRVLPLCWGTLAQLVRPVRTQLPTVSTQARNSSLPISSVSSSFVPFFFSPPSSPKRQDTNLQEPNQAMIFQLNSWQFCTSEWLGTNICKDELLGEAPANFSSFISLAWVWAPPAAPDALTPPFSYIPPQNAATTPSWPLRMLAGCSPQHPVTLVHSF